MAFSFTVNGVYYTEADFEPSNYHYNFLRLLRDCVETLPASLKANGNNTGAGVYTAATLYVGEGKAFYPGMAVIAYLDSSLPPVISYMTVTSYSSGVLTSTIVHTYGTPPSYESDKWKVVCSGSLRTLSSAPYTGLSSLPSTTVEAVKKSATLARPQYRLEPYFEDFIGNMPEMTNDYANGVQLYSSVPGLSVSVYGNGRAVFNGNTLEAFADGNSPGVAVLEVSNPLDEVVMTGKGSYDIGHSQCVKFRVFIPKCFEGEEVEIYFGQAAGHSSYVGAWICYNVTGERSNGGQPLEGRYQSLPSGPSYYLKSVVEPAAFWAEGRWVYITVNRNPGTPATYSAYIEDDYSNYYAEVSSMPGFEGSSGTEVGSCFPSVVFRKKKGSRPCKLYVDYMASNVIYYSDDFSR